MNNENTHYIKEAQPIKGNLAKIIALEVIEKINQYYKCNMSPLGSTGKKPENQTSGDIDIAIEYDWNKRNDIIDLFKDCIQGHSNEKLHVYNIGYLYKDNNVDKYVQIDFMFTDNVEFAQFAYNSPDFTKNESKYKGMYQSTLLMSIVENTPVKDILGDKYKEELFTKNDYDGSYDGNIKSYWKLYLDQNEGLKCEHKTFEGKTKPTKNPSTIKEDTIKISKDVNKIIKDILGEKATKNTCRTFENELTYICSNDYKYKSKKQLEKIKETFLNDWQFKLKTSSELIKEFENIFDEEIKTLKE